MKREYLLGSGLTLILLTLLVAYNQGWVTQQYTEVEREELEELRESKEKKDKAKQIGEYFALRQKMVGDLDDPEQRKNFYNILSYFDSKGVASVSRAEDDFQWRDLGPDNVGGRTRALVIDKDDNQVMYTGGVSGGTWKSTNGGQTWRPTGDLSVYNGIVSCMTQTTSGDLYYGTGEAQLTSSGVNGEKNSAFIGAGVYKSSDRGENWALLPATDPRQGLQGRRWENIQSIVAHPTDGNVIFAATSNGLMRTDDGGNSWEVDFASIGQLQVVRSIDISAENTDIYIGVRTTGRNSMRFYRRPLSGGAWVQIGAIRETSLPDTDIGNALIRAAHNSNDVVYVAAANTAGEFRAIYRSEDKGTNFTQIVQGTFYQDPLSVITAATGTDKSRQGYYNLAFDVDPANDNRVFIGGTTFWEAELVPGTSRFTFRQISQYSPEFFSNGFRNNTWLHADNHLIVFDKSTDPYTMYITNDGGIHKTDDIGVRDLPTYQNADFGYSTVQFYSISVNKARPYEVLGGSQDNGTILVNRTGITKLSGYEQFGGDGFFTEISELDQNIFFAESVYGNVVRSFNRGNEESWSNFFDDNIPPSGAGAYPFMTAFSLYENANDEQSVDSVTITVDDDYKAGDSFEIISNAGIKFRYASNTPVLKGTRLRVKDPVRSLFFVAPYNGLFVTTSATRADISVPFVKVATLPLVEILDMQTTTDGDIHYAVGVTRGGSTGKVYRVKGLRGKKLTPDMDLAEAGIEFKEIASYTGLPVTGIGVDPTNADHVVITLGSYNDVPKVLRSTNATADNVLFSNAAGSGAGALPTFPCYDVAIIRDSTNQVHYLLASEYGMWYSTNNGSSWEEQNTGMYRIPVFKIVTKTHGEWYPGPVVYIGTHGRGIFSSEKFSGNAVGISHPTKQKAKTASLGLSVYPNPLTGNNLKLKYNLPSNVSQLTATITNIEGKQVYTRQLGTNAAGSGNQNLQLDGLKRGVYFITLRADKLGYQTTKLIVN